MGVLKGSADQEKIEAEYRFYRNLPSNLKKFFVKTYLSFNWNEETFYLMKNLNESDVGEVLTNFPAKIDIVQLMNHISIFFKEAKSHSLPLDDPNRFKTNLMAKNNLRLKILTTWNGYKELDNFSKKEIGLDLRSYFSKMNEKLSGFNFKQQAYVFSHGDLCLSNMIFKNNTLSLFDPKGYDYDTQESFRPIEYDLAKLSHSLLGHYEWILRDINCAKDLSNTLSQHFQELLKELNISYDSIRLNESSLFLSMIPLHSENSERVKRFLKKSHEILEELN